MKKGGVLRRWSTVSLWVSTTREDSWILLALSDCSFDRLNIVLLEELGDLSGSYAVVWDARDEVEFTPRGWKKLRIIYIDLKF